MADNEAALAARIQKELRIVPNFPITGIPFM